MSQLYARIHLMFIRSADLSLLMEFPSSRRSCPHELAETPLRVDRPAENQDDDISRKFQNHGLIGDRCLGGRRIAGIRRYRRVTDVHETLTMLILFHKIIHMRKACPQKLAGRQLETIMLDMVGGYQYHHFWITSYRISMFQATHSPCFWWSHDS